jgi:hypothetical protein
MLRGVAPRAAGRILVERILVERILVVVRAFIVITRAMAGRSSFRVGVGKSRSPNSSPIDS